MRLLWAVVMVAAVSCTAARSPGTPSAPSEAVPVARVVHPDSAVATKSFMEANRLAGGAIREKKWALAASYMDEADRHAPSHPLVLAHAARLRARAGDTASAVRLLRRLAPIGLTGPLRKDSTLSSIIDSRLFSAFSKQLDDAALPRVTSDTAFVIGQPDLLIEGIAHSVEGTTQSPTFYVGSMNTGEILRVVALAGAPVATSQFAVTSGRPLGMKVDRLGKLWVNVWATNPAHTKAGVRPLVPPATSSLNIYDTRTGNLLQSFASPRDTVSHQFNDMAITGSGDAYVTDTDAGQVWLISPSAGRVTSFVANASNFSFPNGIALSTEDKRLYVAHLEGISVWDLKTGIRTHMKPPAGAALTGIDGLYACGNGLVAIQQVAGFTRVSLFKLSRSGDAVVGSEVLEQNHPAYAEPTTGTIAGDAFYYIATSEVVRQKPDGTLAPTSRATNSLVLRIPLGNRCR